MKKTYPTYEEAQSIVQKAGIKSIREYKACYKKYGLPSAPGSNYKGKGWIDWYSFLGTANKSLPTYEEAQSIVQKAGVRQISDYVTCYKELGLPSEPHNTYKGKGWTNWYDFLGKKGGSYPSYEEAKGILKEHGIQSIPKYKSCYNKLGLPSAPDRHYKGKGWVGWYDLFGKEEVSFPSYEEAHRTVQTNGVKSVRDYKASYRALGLPSAPERYYLDKGWVSWTDFLCKSTKITSGERKYRILKRLSITPSLLKEDAPLKIIYIFVSQFNMELAKEIESLLGTSSYEERLNWVKKQLKGLKEGSPSKVKSSGETTTSEMSSVEPSESSEDFPDGFPIEDSSDDSVEEEPDELSAMESIIEDNDDVIKTLSEKDIENFNITWENYVHNVINRELISEFDD